MRAITDRLRVALTVEQLWQPVPGGSGTYIVELLRAFAGRDDVDARGLAAAHRRPVPGVLAGVPVAHAPLPRHLLYDAWNLAATPRAERIAGGVDVVHATTWAVPPTRLPLVVTVHDLVFLHEPEHFTARGVRFFTRSWRRVLDEADLVITPSEHTAEDCREHGLEPARIRVVPHGVRVPEVGGAQVEEWLRRAGVSRPYVLWTGTREPRKNLAGLLAAHELLRADLPDLELVLVGPQGWGAAERPEGGGVHLVGKLSARDLHAAYAGAAVFCYPSLREGFGLPVLEAMAHGLPVVTSQGTPMAELVDAPSAGLVVDPGDPASIAAGIRGALAESDRLSAAARGRAARFTWDETASQTIRAYRDAWNRR